MIFQSYHLSTLSTLTILDNAEDYFNNDGSSRLNSGDLTFSVLEIFEKHLAVPESFYDGGLGSLTTKIEMNDFIKRKLDSLITNNANIDLIKERSAFILEATKSIFEKIDPDNALVKSHLFIAELDGIALNYLAIYEDFPLAQIKQQLIKKYGSNEFYENR